MGVNPHRWEEYPDKTAKSAIDFLKYVIDEIKKIDPDAKIGADITCNGKAYTCKTKKGRERDKAKVGRWWINSLWEIIKDKKLGLARKRKLWYTKSNRKEKGGDE